MRRQNMKKSEEDSEEHEGSKLTSKMALSQMKLTARPSTPKLFLMICIFAAGSIILFSLYHNRFLSVDTFFVTNFDKTDERKSQENVQHEDNSHTEKRNQTTDEKIKEQKSEESDLKAKENQFQESTEKPTIIEKKENIIDKKQTTATEKEIQPNNEEYNVLFQLVNAEKESKFASNFYACIKSILTRTNLNLSFHITVDEISKVTAERAFNALKEELHLNKDPKRTYYIVEELNKKIYPYTKRLQELFSSGPNTYYNHAIFFIATAMHKILPKSMKRLVMMDTDLQLRTDIRHLFTLFEEMPSTSIMALAREQQPVYRHVLWNYRNSNPGTKVGEPPPDGLTGFNSGVKLMNLERMRKSKEYNDVLENENVTKLAEKYSFKGHLGDQDFFSLASFEHPGLFHMLRCQWNRQLCTWWREHGYKDVFDMYFKCEPPYYVLHGNCNTPIPD